MIFSQDLVSYDDFHNKIVIAGVEISSLTIAERKSRIGGNESTSNVVSDDATANILSSIQMYFGLVLKRWILWHIQCLGVDRWIQHKDYSLAPTFNKALFI